MVRFGMDSLYISPQSSVLVKEEGGTGSSSKSAYYIVPMDTAAIADSPLGNRMSFIR